MFAFPDVFHFFAHKLASLGGRRLAFALVLAGSFYWFFFWHNKMVSPLATRLDVINNGRYAESRHRQSAFTCACNLERRFAGCGCEKLGLTQILAREAQQAPYFGFFV